MLFTPLLVFLPSHVFKTKPLAMIRFEACIARAGTEHNENKPLENSHFGGWEETLYSLWFNVIWDFYRRAFGDGSTLLSFFLFLTPFKGEYSIFSLILQWLQLSLNEETERILIELVRGNGPSPKMECFMKNCIPQKNVPTIHQLCLLLFTPRTTWLHSLILVFVCIRS